jgi:hypothetical protein
MPVSLLALAAAAAAQAAAPQTQWVPLQQSQQAATPVSATPQEQPSAAPSPAVVPQGPTAPVAAASLVPHGITLWRNIEDGMSVAQLRALYPQGPNVAYKDDRTVLADVPIIEGCQAKVNVMHPAGVVKEIVMRGEGSIAGRCSIKIITALSGKYGEPMDKDKVRGSLVGREGKNYIWAHDGVTMQFKRYTNGPLGGGGLLAASWEMRYSSVDTKIDM